MPEQTQPAATNDWLPTLQEDVKKFQAELQEVIKAQDAALKKQDQAPYVELYLKYNDISREIKDRNILIDLLGATEDRLESDLYKASFWQYLVAAETVSLDLVDELTNRMYEAAKKDFDEAESYDQFHAPYKHIVIPGKIIGNKFDEIDPLIDEMNNFIMAKIPEYDRSKSLEVLPVAFGMAIDSDTANIPVKEALEQRNFQWLMPEEKERLLAEVIEQEAFVTDAREKDKIIAAARFREKVGGGAKPAQE